MTRKVGTSATWFNWRHKPQALEQSIEGLLGGFSIMSLDLVGSPDVVAAQMAKAMEHNGGNGFLYTHRGILWSSNRYQVSSVVSRSHAVIWLV
jgi:hypothetical protein